MNFIIKVDYRFNKPENVVKLLNVTDQNSEQFSPLASRKDFRKIHENAWTQENSLKIFFLAPYYRSNWTKAWNSMSAIFSKGKFTLNILQLDMNRKNATEPSNYIQQGYEYSKKNSLAVAKV